MFFMLVNISIYFHKINTYFVINDDKMIIMGERLINENTL